jgi:PAS domain S-box-containing protein
MPGHVLWGADVDLTAATGIVDAMDEAAGAAIVTQTSGGQEQIVATNRAWRQLCGFGAEEALGRSPKILQGPQTDKAVACRFRDDLLTQGHAEATLLNYTKRGRPFVHELHSRSVVDGATGATFHLTQSSERPASVLYSDQKPRAVDDPQPHYSVNALVRAQPWPVGPHAGLPAPTHSPSITT